MPTLSFLSLLQQQRGKNPKANRIGLGASFAVYCYMSPVGHNPCDLSCSNPNNEKVTQRRFVWEFCQWPCTFTTATVERVLQKSFDRPEAMYHLSRF
ncbi:hypothetical protein N7447_004499 [Penicillium robsamsonii]|uniref:uncharacterized protein n=1 Tax=Penicillium robsamsonii TaxID=1792511 RepID=UPI0025498951|nr:uncharacterized protein N7447_004499 [Penicillium robsamsonii]KAJ5827736.1 hypothetical protein N7447_004499 [Penicillium robsamsonii]